MLSNVQYKYQIKKQNKSLTREVLSCNVQENTRKGKCMKISKIKEIIERRKRGKGVPISIVMPDENLT